MFFKLSLQVLGLFLFSQISWALDTTQCPQKLKISAQIIRVFKTSIYSSVPGWKTAQQTLDSIDGFESNQFLASKTSKACLYKDRDGSSSAVLATASFNDPEESSPTLVDQLTVKIEIDGSHYISFLPIKSFTKYGIQLHSNPYQLKIKTQLENKQLNRISNYDLGMISVTLK
jgi:hypothetical protein